LPGLNFGTFFAGICIFLPVAGFTPTRLLRFIVTNVPNPVSETVLLCLSALPTQTTNASKALLQAALGSLLAYAMLSINSALFIPNPSFF
jgi:hypothetical protein